ncbi:MAG: hypothetical protein ACI33M_07305 [Lysinibacillus sp.]
MEDSKFAQLTSDTLAEITELEKKLGVILIAYENPHSMGSFYSEDYESYPINPS